MPWVVRDAVDDINRAVGRRDVNLSRLSSLFLKIVRPFGPL